MRSVKSCSAVSGEWARERRSWAMWGFEVVILGDYSRDDGKCEE